MGRATEWEKEEKRWTKRGRKGQKLDETERLESQGGGINDNERVISL